MPDAMEQSLRLWLRASGPRYVLPCVYLIKVLQSTLAVAGHASHASTDSCSMMPVPVNCLAMQSVAISTPARLVAETAMHSNGKVR